MRPTSRNRLGLLGLAATLCLAASGAGRGAGPAAHDQLNKGGV